MNSLYIHIPFCKSRCTYCAFHSGTNFSLKENYIKALSKELDLRCNYLQNNKLDTIYFGGGTPSVLSAEQLELVFSAVQRNFDISQTREITIECNPDDINEQFIEQLSKFPFNRISLGIQSFNDTQLKRLNRRHTTQQAEHAVKALQHAGYNNISIDLMFGLPEQTLTDWQQTLEKALLLDVQHISAYSLTYEEGTPLYTQLTKGKIVSIDDETYREMFEMLVDKLQVAGFEHYEISNFALPGYASQHNSAYWHNVPYLGIGAAAHSYDGHTRQWNVADTAKYMESIENGIVPFTKEELICEEQYNEFVFTGIRTKEGVDLQELAQKFGEELKNYCLHCAQRHVDNQTLQISDNHLHLTRAGVFVSDGIMADLMKV